MLKIRDDVDLKELEKFGFKECCDYFYTEEKETEERKHLKKYQWYKI